MESNRMIPVIQQFPPRFDDFRGPIPALMPELAAFPLLFNTFATPTLAAAGRANLQPLFEMLVLQQYLQERQKCFFDCRKKSPQMPQADLMPQNRTSKRILTPTDSTLRTNLLIKIRSTEKTKTTDRPVGERDGKSPLEPVDSTTSTVKKRFRRTAAEIVRTFKCPEEGCGKAYGVKFALKNHIRIKHHKKQ